jgi:hypothetical protein
MCARLLKAFHRYIPSQAAQRIIKMHCILAKYGIHGNQEQLHAYDEHSRS